MRELKFRAWDGKEMKPAFDLTQNPKFWWEENKDYPLMQFTGLKDKNGKEIYEGDIVKITDEFGDVTVGKVEWGLSSKNYGTYPAFCIYEFESEMNSFAEIYDSGIYEIEIIGNIYEHSHLLEGESNV